MYFHEIDNLESVQRGLSNGDINELDTEAEELIHTLEEKGEHSDFIRFIDPQSNLLYNGVTIVFGAKGSGKTRNLLKEILKVSLLPDCGGYTFLLFVTNTPQDMTLNRIKPLIEKRLQVRVIPYSSLEEQLKLIFSAKEAYYEVKTKGLERELTSSSRNRILNVLGVKDFSRKVVNTLVQMDDAQNILSNATGTGGTQVNHTGNNFLKQSLLRTRQTNMTYILTLQDPKGIATEMKANADSVWIFGGLPRSKIMKLFSQLPHIEDVDTSFQTYNQLEKNDVMVFFFLTNKTLIRVIRSRFYSDTKRGARSVMIETEDIEVGR
jgi:hypothetical protein